MLLDLVGDDDEEGEITAEFERRVGGIRESLLTAEEGTRRIADIVEGMRASSRQDDGALVPVDPVACLESTLKLIRTSVSHPVEFKIETSERGSIHGNASQLNQVFVNLLVNACHAIEARAQLEQGDYAGAVHLQSTLADQQIVLTIRDNGCGMTDEVKSRIFEAFFTTKGSDKGTGLGMSICSTIIEAHSGQLEVSSTPGDGTVISLTFPLLSRA